MTETVTRDAPAAKTETEKPTKEKRISEQPVDGKEPAGSSAPAGQVQATSGSPPEVTLAVIDAESTYVKKLAESALTASHDVTAGSASKLSILAVPREVVGTQPAGQCIPAFERVAQRHGA